MPWDKMIYLRIIAKDYKNAEEKLVKYILNTKWQNDKDYMITSYSVSPAVR
jgi:hypothetical protein